MSHTLARYGQKIDIKVHEAVIALLHEIIAPDAPFLCAHDCSHVHAGASPDELRRFFDALDLHQAQCSRSGSSGHGTYAEDQREEALIVWECRRDLAKILGLPPEPAPGELPPEKARLIPLDRTPRERK